MLKQDKTYLDVERRERKPRCVGGHQLALTRWLEGDLNLRGHKLHPKLIRDLDIDGLP